MKKSILRNTLLAAMMASLTGGASAAGLGRINVFSALGQPLRAEVEIAATPDELDAMSARLASVEAHTRANIEYSGELRSVKLAIERKTSGGAVVKISSDRAFNEPFVDMLVELSWVGGRILREYTFLLDPAEVSAVKALPMPSLTPPVAKTEPVPQPAAPIVSQPPVSSEVQASSSSAAAKPEKSTGKKSGKAAKEEVPFADTSVSRKSVEGDYTVAKGDSASSIADKLKPVEVSRDQMMAALYQANQTVFTGGNINRLRAGQLLKVPSASEASQISKGEARQIIVKASSFESLKSDIAKSVAESAPKTEKSAQTGRGKLTPSVEEKGGAAAQPKDQLKIGKTEVDKGGKALAKDSADAGKANARVHALEEDIAARDKALKEAQSRAADLERNVKELEKLVQMKSQSLAELQKQAAAGGKIDAKAAKAAEKAAKEQAALEAKQAKEKAAAEAKAAKEKAAAEAKAAKEKAIADAKAAKEKSIADAKAAKEKAAEDARLAKEKAEADKKAAAEAKAAEAKAAADKAAAEKDAAAKAAADKAAADKAAAEAAAAQSAAPVETAAASAPAESSVAEPMPSPMPAAATPKPDTAKIVEPQDEGSWYTNPLVLGGIAAVLGIGGLVAVRQRRRAAAAGVMTTSLSEASTSPNSVFGNAGGQTVDTGTSVLHTDFSQSGLSAIDADEGVDPVAEADVYMAYGRDAQAEEILLDALKNDPTRVAIHLKLLEIYAQRRSLKQFESVATDLYTQTGGNGDDWAKAAALGLKLDPGNPLYGGNANTTVVVPPAAPAAPSIPAPAAVTSIPEPAPAPAPAAPEPAVSFGTNKASQMGATWTVPGEIGQLASGEAPIPQGPDVPASALATSPEPLNLDFNLDLEVPEADGPSTVVESRGDDAPLELDMQDSAGPLEFDLEVEPAPAPAPAPRAAAPAPVAAPVLAGEAALDAAMSGMSESDSMGIERATGSGSLSEVDLEKTNFESSLLDFDFELGEDTNVSRSNMDLSDINVRTDPGFPASAPARNGNSQVEMVDTSAAVKPATGSIDVHDEVSTKLELARAYEEMGDLEGARELLEEVMSDGADQQKEMAKTILSRIA